MNDVSVSSSPSVLWASFQISPSSSFLPCPAFSSAEIQNSDNLKTMLCTFARRNYTNNNVWCVAESTLSVKKCKMIFEPITYVDKIDFKKKKNTDLI